MMLATIFGASPVLRILPARVFSKFSLAYPLLLISVLLWCNHIVIDSGSKVNAAYGTSPMI
jgi:hypothetical protein